jgi:molybdenum cofactor biosynthesis enzyme MoaA
MYDFANILFSGPCNAHCYFCIGREIDPTLRPNNLNTFPPLNLAAFIDLIHQYEIRQVIFTGTDTDPQLYQHETRLLIYLRQQLHSETQFSLHTNGRLSLHKMETFNLYDRASISFPSFDPIIYRQMMGVPKTPNLPQILQQATIPVKISCLVTAENAAEIPQFLTRCQNLMIQRVVLRKRFGERKPWDALLPTYQLFLNPQDKYRSNPIYAFRGMEVTLWDFDQSSSKSINLFASGLISSNYLLTEASYHN